MLEEKERQMKTFPVSKRDQLTALLQEQFLQCFTAPPGVRAKAGVRPVIRIHFSGLDGSLAGRPVIENPPLDPGSRALTEAMARSIASCAPYRIPQQYAPFFEQWKDVIIPVDLSKLE
jgi:colicin import membrane protein